LPLSKGDNENGWYQSGFQVFQAGKGLPASAVMLGIVSVKIGES
jgi:hypothetical protein